MDVFFLILIFVLAVVLACVIVKVLISCITRRWDEMCEHNMNGKTVLVTGANMGIGKETARDLARRGARVVLACRSIERGNEAAHEIAKSTGSLHVRVMKCDVSSMSSVRTFCTEFMATEARLDVLVLNAGMVPPPGKHMTEEGHEQQLATNYLGHFLMTNLLLDKLKTCAPSRIITVSSLLHHFGSIDFDNMSFEKYTPDPFWTYSKSKLCNILMIKELTRRLEGSHVTANALHPGLVRTEINRSTPWYIRNFIEPLFLVPFAKDAVAGAQTTIYLAVSPELKDISGKYYADCKEAWHSRKCEDIDLAKKLWNWSELAVGLKSDA